MKSLYIVRHAKSSWRDAELADIDRPLKARGVSDAHHMAIELVKNKINPDYILSSPAIRALHTAIIFARTIELPSHRIIIRNSLYASSIELYQQVISEVDPAASSIMIFGHDPTATNFVNQFLPDKLEKVPTAGVIGFTFDALDWEDLKKKKRRKWELRFPPKKK